MDLLMTVEGMKFCLILAVELLHIFCFTYCGSMLIDESSNVREMLYSVHWYSFNSNQKKILNIFQVQTECLCCLLLEFIISISTCFYRLCRLLTRFSMYLAKSKLERKTAEYSNLKQLCLVLSTQHHKILFV
ncbi:uncharacterized protein LOC120356026 [Nilaparvata lugens]|uniref:uncharacterized protein LOC120356026 n=1 Tax=Nilaparvata lugens TaxID=108931 RepID=UPI00193CD1FF|nr:uncharacterized protein LOC120356026 [Nilaparvata lugens]